MKRIGRKIKWTLVIAAAGVLLAAWFLTRPVSWEARREFAWVNTLGFPEVKNLRCVRVTTGWQKATDDEPENTYVTGFLLATNGSNFTILTSDFRQRNLTLTTNRAPNEEQVSYEDCDFPGAARRGLDLLKQLYVVTNNEEIAEIRETSPAWTEFLAGIYDERASGPGAPSRGELFFLAWACWQRGLKTEAGRYYELARLPPAAWNRYMAYQPRGWEAFKDKAGDWIAKVKRMFSRNPPDDDEDKNLHEVLNDAFAYIAMCQAAEAFDDEKLSRTDLLARVESVLKRYPDSDQRTNAVNLATSLRTLIAADRKHITINSNDFEKLPVEAKAAELVFQLRNERGIGDEWGNWPDPDDLTNEPVTSPGLRLLQMGYAAVPQLIVVYDSDLPSRSPWPRAGYFKGNSPDDYSPDRLLTVGSLARTILEKITGRDFELANTNTDPTVPPVLPSPGKLAAEAWLAGFRIKGQQQMLIEGVLAGLRDAPHQAELLCEHFPESATTNLYAGLRASRDENIRAQLVTLLADHGDESAIGMLQRELTNDLSLALRVEAARGLRKRGHAAEAEAAMFREWERAPLVTNGVDESEDVVGFLVGCDSPQIIERLMQSVKSQPPDRRKTVIAIMGDLDAWYYPPASNAPSAETLAAIEQGLVSALDDTGQCLTEFGDHAGFPGERICDLAARLLHDRWPDRYNFDGRKSLQVRERQRVECQNVWRKAHDLPLLPAPKSETVRVSPGEANKVTAIDWGEGSVKPDPRFAAVVGKLKDQVLRMNDIVNLLTNAPLILGPDAGGILIEARRDSDLSGIQLWIKLLPVPPIPAAPSQWNTMHSVAIGSNSTGTTYSGGSLETLSDRDYWRDFQRQVVKALAATPDKPFRIRVSIEGKP